MNNFLKLKPRLLRDIYVYVDDKIYTIDMLLINEQIHVKFLSDMEHPDYPEFTISFLSCWKWDSKIIEETIFPKLDKALFIKHGNKYRNYLKNIKDTLIENGVEIC